VDYRDELRLCQPVHHVPKRLFTISPVDTPAGGEGKLSLTPNEYRALLRRDFVSFAQCCFRELNPRTRFAVSWHIEIIAAKLMAVRDGKIRRLVIN
jgi:hypothetical protein